MPSRARDEGRRRPRRRRGAPGRSFLTSSTVLEPSSSARTVAAMPGR
ncbi:hypothetical protein [Nonomuraea dietziae]